MGGAVIISGYYLRNNIECGPRKMLYLLFLVLIQLDSIPQFLESSFPIIEIKASLDLHVFPIWEVFKIYAESINISTTRHIRVLMATF